MSLKGRRPLKKANTALLWARVQGSTGDRRFENLMLVRFACAGGSGLPGVRYGYSFEIIV